MELVQVAVTPGSAMQLLSEGNGNWTFVRTSGGFDEVTLAQTARADRTGVILRLHVDGTYTLFANVKVPE